MEEGCADNEVDGGRINGGMDSSGTHDGWSCGVTCRTGQRQQRRLSTTVVKLLKGKIKSHYYPTTNIGDYVILTNADSIIIDKTTNYHIVKNPGRPGYSLKIINVSDILPKITIERTIKGMLSISERKQLMRRLKVYSAKYEK